MNDNKKIELNDEELEKVVGGFAIGDHVKVNCRRVRYCPGCGKLAMYSYGTVVGKTWFEKRQHYFLDIKMDCCGYVDSVGDSACEIY